VAELTAAASKSAGSPFEAVPGRASRTRRTLSDVGRRGLDWERYPSLESFQETVITVVSSPYEAFSTMRRSGGIGNPLGFLVIAYVLGMLLLLVEAFVLLGGFLLLAQWGVIDLGRPVVLQWNRFFIVFGVTALLLLPAAVLSATIGGFIGAVIYHLALLVCGAAHAGFEATYRVFAFGSGAVYMLLPIPIVGPCFAIIMQPIVLIYGAMAAHDTDGWRAILAFFLPALLGACVGGLGMLMLGSSLAILVPAGR
jgi:hypothetical protein